MYLYLHLSQSVNFSLFFIDCFLLFSILWGEWGSRCRMCLLRCMQWPVHDWYRQNKIRSALYQLELYELIAVLLLVLVLGIIAVVCQCSINILMAKYVKCSCFSPFGLITFHLSIFSINLSKYRITILQIYTHTYKETTTRYIHIPHAHRNVCMFMLTIQNKLQIICGFFYCTLPECERVNEIFFTTRFVHNTIMQ